MVKLLTILGTAKT